ncbi:osteoclast stimulatory transmembrane protein [Microcaecilia unicolor]|uniref:Osteoclast stimulatory transmembrane protein n=1 Tax=Microcaecilia unicolor TaxID=1415580 RepID=A0A6P7YWB6_9AMPH|nr:osteoclast stimulatory transmembrane protein [Microcaecilia unicolor]
MTTVLTSMGQPTTLRQRIWNYCKTDLFMRTKSFLLDTWSAYSKPIPENARECLSLLVLCSCIALSTGGLLYNWLSASLRYEFHLAVGISVGFSLLMLFTLVLMHPVRCMVTISVPTLGTKQGRRLLLSTCFMIITFNIIPNIINNIETIVQVLQCISLTSAESLFNSTALLREASHDFCHAVSRVADRMAEVTFQSNKRRLEFVVHFEESTVRNQMHGATQKIKDDFSAVEKLIGNSMLMSNRVIAGIFIFYLFFGSAWYLKCYLTDLSFDNIYITKNLERMAFRNNTTHLLTSASKKLIKSTGLKLSKREVFTCLLRIIVLSFFLLSTLVIIVTDHIAFHLAVEVENWVHKFPTVPMTLDIAYSAKISFVAASLIPIKVPDINVISFNKRYQRDFAYISADCTFKSNPPNTLVTITVGFMYCIVYAMVFLETYAHRLCRKISASFFEEQEEQRVLYLYNKILQKHQKKQEIFGHHDEERNP